MEFILVIAVLGALCFILNISMDIIISVVCIVISVLIVLTMLFFIYFNARLIFTKKYEAKFTRIEKGKSFRHACYSSDGVEYPCIFPEEGVFTNKLYRTDKIYKVRLNRRMKKVYDRFAFTTCIVGLASSVPMTVFIAYMIFFAL